MYTDAAWNHVTKCAGFAWIIDDAATATFVSSPLTVETLTLKQAMTSARRPLLDDWDVTLY